MAPWNIIVRAFLVFENVIVERLLSSPAFHRGVRRIHRAIEERKYGRDPNEPLRQGEATEEPGTKQGFLSYFLDELRNQVRGTPSKVSPPPPPPSPPKK